MDRGAWWATVHRVAELDTTKWLHFHFFTFFSFLPMYLLSVTLSLLKTISKDLKYTKLYLRSLLPMSLFVCKLK